MTNTIPFQELQARITGEVHADALRRLMLATDGSIFQEMPACVVYPRTAEDVAETVRFAGKHGLTIHPRGAGSGLTGAALGSGIVIDFTKFMNRLLLLDEEKQLFVCEPGYRFGELEDHLKGKPLFFPPDPSSGEYATFGGMFGTNASGGHSAKYGNVSDYVLDADMVLADGTRITLSEIEKAPVENLPENLQALVRMYEDRKEEIEAAYPPVRCNVAGYNLRGLVRNNHLHLQHLFTGAEGTLGIATRLVFKLQPKPPFDSLVVVYFNNIIDAAKASQAVIPMNPAGIEIMDKSLLNLAKESEPGLRDKIPEGIDNAILFEFDGETPEICSTLASEALEKLKGLGLADMAYQAVSAEEKAQFWAVRKAAVPILYRLKGKKKILALIEDAAVPVDRLVDFFEGLYGILGGLGVTFVLYGHIAKGLIHSRPLLNLKDAGDVALLKTIADRVYELVTSLDGSVSGEHGDGRLRSAYVKLRYPGIYDLFHKTKELLDKENRLNPEIITHHDPDQMMQDLRYGASYGSRDPGQDQLIWPETFVTEAERCHGCSKCTTLTTVTRMCPVYKATRDEAAAPKAKANLLRALVSGKIPDQVQYEAAFQQVMDLCANCGSCASECPSNVNIPKLAMEARARYVAKFGPSLHSRLVTHVETFGRKLHKVSAPLRILLKVPGVGRVSEAVTGVSANRDVLDFASKSLFDRVPRRAGKGDMTVLFYAGCYAGWMKPEIGEALVKVLSRMNITVITPPQHCCGLPAMTKGMTEEARGMVRKNLAAWGSMLDQVSHIVVTCSSCGHALMKDWGELLSDDKVAQIAEKVIHASRFLDFYRDRLSLAEIPETVAYHHPCHLKIQADPNSSVRFLSNLPGVTVDVLNSHCCGMIGSWGMAAKNFDTSRKIASDLVEKLDKSQGTCVVTDCPTCRMQLEAFGSKKVKHPVEVAAERLLP